MVTSCCLSLQVTVLDIDPEESGLPKTNIVYIKTDRAAGSTISTIFKSYGLLNNLTMILSTVKDYGMLVCGLLVIILPAVGIALLAECWTFTSWHG